MKKKSILHKEAEEMSLKVVEQIKRAKQEWEVTVDALVEIVCLLDSQGYLIRANRTIERWNLGQVLDIKGKEIHTLFHPVCADSNCELKMFLLKSLENIARGESARCEIKDSILKRYLSLQIRPISTQTDKAGKSAESFAVLIATDITERKQIEKALQDRNYELSLLNDMSDSLQACNTEEETYHAVIRICRQLFPSDSGCLFILNNTKTSLKMVACWGTPSPGPHIFDIGDCQALQKNMIYMRENPDTHPPCPHLRAFPHDAYLCTPVSTSNDILGVLSLRFGHEVPDFYERDWERMIHAKRMVVDRVATHYALFLVNLRFHERDHLTGLYNRYYMEQSLKRETHRAERRNTAIFMLDIDHFKEFNDKYSYEAGDLVLRELGGFLRSKIRSDDIACRYGGEEFLLILPESTLETASRRAEELRIGIKNLNVTYQGVPLSITISIGVAALPQHGPGIENAVRAADVALHQAKARGRNQVVIAS